MLEHHLNDCNVLCNLMGKGQLLKCYITYDMDFWFISSDPMCLTSCHVVISKTGQRFRSNRCVTRRRPRDENHMDKFRQSAEKQSWAKDTQPSRGVSDDTACKGVQALASPGSWEKIWDKKKFPLCVYISPSISQITNWGPLSRIKWEIYFCKQVFRSFIIFDYVLGWVYEMLQQKQASWSDTSSSLMIIHYFQSMLFINDH